MNFELPHSIENAQVGQEDLFLNRGISRVIDETPEVTPSELISLMLPGDVLLTAMPGYRIRSITKAMSVAILKMLQRSPFNSSKLVGNDGKLLGYGLSEVRLQFVAYSAKVYVSRLQRCLLLRHADMTMPLAQDIITEAKKHLGMPYSFSDLIMSTVEHLKRKTGLLKVKIDVDAVEYRPLICSSIIGALFYQFGLEVSDQVNWRAVWPGDFALSPKFQAIAQVNRTQ